MATIKPPTLTKLYIGNHLINARYNYSLIQERIFNYVIFQCQEYIKLVKDGKSVEQLDIFTASPTPNCVRLKIPLKHIGRHEEYSHIRESMQKMIGILVQTPVVDKEGKSWQQWRGIFQTVYEPADMIRCGYMYVEIDQAVAKMLVNIERKEDGTPKNFTTFMYEIAANAKNKYTPRLYKLISSYAHGKKTGFYISVEDLRDYLQLGSKYKDTNALRTWILKPVSDELKEDADCWFNVVDAEFEQKEGKKVLGFNFKVVGGKHSVNYRAQVDYLIYLFKTEYHLDGGQVEQLRPIFENTSCWDSLLWRLSKINQRLKENNNIANVAAYVTTSVLNHFKEK